MADSQGRTTAKPKSTKPKNRETKNYQPHPLCRAPCTKYVKGSIRPIDVPGPRSRGGWEITAVDSASRGTAGPRTAVRVDHTIVYTSLLDLFVSSLCRGHANLICIVPI